MKVCLSSRQAGSYLVHADEIKVQYRDRAVIPELAEKYPKATIILRQDIKEPIDFNECEKYKILTRDKLMICLSDLSVANECKRHEIPFYWGWRVQTYSQLNSLKFLGVSYVLLDAPLFFELDKVKSKGIPIRAYQMLHIPIIFLVLMEYLELGLDQKIWKHMKNILML